MNLTKDSENLIGIRDILGMSSVGLFKFRIRITKISGTVLYNLVRTTFLYYGYLRSIDFVGLKALLLSLYYLTAMTRLVTKSPKVKKRFSDQSILEDLDPLTIHWICQSVLKQRLKRSRH